MGTNEIYIKQRESFALTIIPHRESKTAFNFMASEDSKQLKKSFPYINCQYKPVIMDILCKLVVVNSYECNGNLHVFLTKIMMQDWKHGYKKWSF